MRKVLDLGSPVMSSILFATSLMNLWPSSQIGPKVSTAIGTKNRFSFSIISLYNHLFLVAAFSATFPCLLLERFMCDGAKVSVHVASQDKICPLDQGVKVIPSGRFLDL